METPTVTVFYTSHGGFLQARSLVLVYVTVIRHTVSQLHGAVTMSLISLLGT